MEGQFATHALILEQQRRIKTLETELEAARLEIAQLRSSSLQSACAASSGAIGVDGQHSNTKSAGLPNCQRPPTEDPKKGSSRYWTADEHTRFLEGLKLFGQKDIKSISRHVGTRSATQVRTHAQKYYLRIERERAKADGTTLPTGTITARERRCNQKGRPRSRGNATSGGSLSAESAGGEAGTSTNNGSSCTGDVQERSGERMLGSPEIEFKFADDGGSSADFKNVTVLDLGNESQMEQGEPLKAQTECKIRSLEAGKTVSNAKESDVVEIVKTDEGDIVKGIHDIGTSADDVCARIEDGNNVLDSDRQRLNNGTYITKIEDKLLRVSEASNHGAQNREDQMEYEDQKVAKCEVGGGLEPQTEVEMGKRRMALLEEVPRQAKKRSKSIQRGFNGGVVAGGSAEVRKTDLDGSGAITLGLGPGKEGQVISNSSAENEGTPVKQVADAGQNDQVVDKRNQSSHGKAVDDLKPDSRGDKEPNGSDVHLDTKAHIAVSTQLNASLPTVDAEAATWSAQLPPRGCTERGQVMGLLESGGSTTNLRSLFQLSGTDSGFGTKAMTLRRNGSSNSVLADLPKHSGFLSRSNSFLISNSGKGVTRSSSILSLLSGLPTTMRESASSDRLLGLDNSNPDGPGADDEDCADFGEYSVVQSRLISTSLLGRVNGTGGDSGLGDRCLSFGQLHHMGVDDLEDAGAVALSLSDDAERWTADSDCSKARSRLV